MSNRPAWWDSTQLGPLIRIVLSSVSWMLLSLSIGALVAGLGLKMGVWQMKGVVMVLFGSLVLGFWRIGGLINRFLEEEE